MDAEEELDIAPSTNYLGSTGRSSAPQVHHGVYFQNKPIDSKPYLDVNGIFPFQ